MGPENGETGLEFCEGKTFGPALSNLLATVEERNAIANDFCHVRFPVFARCGSNSQHGQ